MYAFTTRIMMTLDNKHSFNAIWVMQEEFTAPSSMNAIRISNRASHWAYLGVQTPVVHLSCTYQVIILLLQKLLVVRSTVRMTQ